jgi:nucleotidyltransferase/DNA polymerase involved in DNA repair
MRIGCILIPHFAAQMEIRRRPEFRGQPLVLLHSIGSHRAVFDASPRAKNVLPGMSLQEVQARCPDAVFLDADPFTYRVVLGRILDTLETISPAVEESNPGLTYVNLWGLSSLYGGEARIATALLQAIPPGFYPQVGIGTGKFAAYVAATRANYHGAFQAMEDTRSFVVNIPVEMLPIPWAVITRFRDFGLERLGQVATLGIGPMQAQFGHHGKLAWDLACGRDQALVIPRKRKESIAEQLTFDVPLVSAEMVLAGVELLLARAWNHPERRGRHVRHITLDGLCSSGTPWSQETVFREAIGDSVKVFRILKGKIASMTLPSPLETLTMTLSGFIGEIGQQGSLLAHVRRQEQLRETLRQLDIQLDGSSPVYRYREVEPWSRIPERRHALIPFAP